MLSKSAAALYLPMNRYESDIHGIEQVYFSQNVLTVPLEKQLND